MNTNTIIANVSIEIVAEKIGTKLQFFHGTKAEIAEEHIYYRNFQMHKDLKEDGVESFHSSGGRVILKDFTFNGR